MPRASLREMRLKLRLCVLRLSLVHDLVYLGADQ